MNDPVVTDPQLYRVVWENERVRVLEYRDTPGDATHLHAHPDSVMVTLSPFERVISVGGREVPVTLEAGEVRWLDAQQHQGRNVGRTATHSVFIELKEPRPDTPRPDATRAVRPLNTALTYVANAKTQYWNPIARISRGGGFSWWLRHQSRH